MRVVIDTGELLRMAAAAGRSPIFEAWEELRIELVMSAATITELADVLSRPQIQRFVPKRRGDRFLNLVQQRGLFVNIATNYPKCRDPGDDNVIATAVGGSAQYLITIDKDIYDDPRLVSNLQQLGILVVQPGAFINQLRRSQ